MDLLATRLGATVEAVEMDQDGRLEVVGNRAMLLVNADQPWARQRFSAAHELCHWVLRSPTLYTAQAQETERAFHMIETMCNTVAGALLMPYWWLRNRFSRAAEPQSTPTLALLGEVAGQADVSFGAAAVRMREVFGWQRTLLHWTIRDGSWTYDGEAGLFPWEQGLVIPTSNVDLVLSQVRSLNLSEATPAELPLIINGWEGDYRAEIMAHGRYAVALIELPEPERPASLYASRAA